MKADFKHLGNNEVRRLALCCLLMACIHPLSASALNLLDRMNIHERVVWKAQDLSTQSVGQALAMQIPSAMFAASPRAKQTTRGLAAGARRQPREIAPCSHITHAD